jgi:hypothetical protein
MGLFALGFVIKDVSILASKWEFPGTSPITPVTIYLTVSEPILTALSIGFSFPKIFFAVDSANTTLCGAFRRFFGSPFKTGIEKILKNEESASII